MGTSSRRLAPERMRDKIKKIDFDENNRLSDSALKDLLKIVFYKNMNMKKLLNMQKI